MRSTRAFVRALTPLRPCKARSTVPMDVPRALAISRMPAALPLLLAVLILLDVFTLYPPLPRKRELGKIDFDSEIQQCVVLFTLTYTHKHLLSELLLVLPVTVKVVD
jgi:hypothetical protein